jgi:sortase family protein
MSPRPPRRRSLLRWAAAGLGLLVIVVVAPRWWGSSQAASSPSGRTPSAGKAAAVVVEARPARRTGTVRPEPPRTVRLPTGAVVPVRAVSTTPEGLLDVPDDIRAAGWWKGGSRLGDPWGATMLAAHVDSVTQGLGPFAALLGARRGQRFVVSSAHLRQTFRATSFRLLDRGPLLRHRWMFSASGDRRIVLVTCAPPYVRSRGGYQRIAVVTAVPTAPPTRAAP